ncbi:unnamed protein product [Lampetra fluviatilis]
MISAASPARHSDDVAADSARSPRQLLGARHVEQQQQQQEQQQEQEDRWLRGVEASDIIAAVSVRRHQQQRQQQQRQRGAFPAPAGGGGGRRGNC